VTRSEVLRTYLHEGMRKSEGVHQFLVSLRFSI
jgi:hypothetical protein